KLHAIIEKTALLSRKQPRNACKKNLLGIYCFLGDTMKLLSFLHRGQPGWGVAQGDEVAVLTSQWPDLASALHAGSQAIGQVLQASRERLPIAGLTFLPPVAASRKIVCVGLNYGR